MLALVATCLLSTSAASASSEVSDGAGAVPILGTFLVQQARDSNEPRAVGAVHGVRRIEGGTVLYFSLGFPEPQNGVSFFSTTRRVLPDDRWGVSDTVWATGYVVDPRGKLAYTALVTREDGPCICSTAASTTDEAGRMFVLYEVFPPLGPDVETVDVALAFDTVVHDVPVEDGLLTPTVASDGPIELGRGWPEIDLDAVAAAPDKQKSIHPLETRVSDLEERVTTVESPDAISVELAADVLFEVDQATLTSDAHDTIARAAETVNARAASGSISIVGHTDSTGSDAHNDDLSRRRAEAVHTALQPLVTVPDVTYDVQGRGEREPIDDNSSEAGRQRNRRVTISFSPKAP